MDLLVWMKALADETRLRLVFICSESEFSVSELTSILGQSQPRVSRHLKILCDAGLLSRYREQSWVFYGLGQNLDAQQFLGTLVSAYRRQMLLPRDRERIEKVLETRDAKAKVAMENYLRQRGPKFFSRDDEKCIKTVLDELFSGQSVGNMLDIGTGAGRMLGLLGAAAKEVIGIDLSIDMLNVARSNLQRMGYGHCMVRHADMYHLPYTHASFDTITMDDVLSHAEYPHTALAEAYRLIKPGGQLIIFEQDEQLSADVKQGLDEGLKSLQLASLQSDCIATESGILRWYFGRK